MRQSLIWSAAALLLVAACETVPEAATDVEGGGGGAAAPLAAVEVTPRPATPVAVVADMDAPAALAPETQEYFVVEVGDRVFFGFDEFTLTERAREVLERQAEWLRAYPNVQVAIEGHTDERGTREYNLALGERRANAVMNYLVALGVDPGRMRTVSWGKERPAALGSNQTAWALNRRSVTTITSGGAGN